MKPVPGLGALLLFPLLALSVLPSRAALTAPDADGRTATLNPPGRVTLVLSSSPDTQDQTRAAGRAVDRYRGRPDFQLVIVVDLRGSFAGIVPGIVRDRMRAELDKEAVRVAPFYRANGNLKDPRPDLESIPDFDGTVCKPLHWAETPDKLRAVLFGPDGREVDRWSDLKEKDYPDLRVAAAKALSK